MVSVIIPVYNGAEYLRECLDSVIGQTYRDMEIILIDDGSTDDSYSICKEYADMDNRIRLIRQENAGVSAARNRGISAASGDYIMFVDADDMLLPNGMADINGQSDIIIFDFLFSKGRFRKEYKKGIDIDCGSADKSKLMWYVMQGGLGYSCGKLYKRAYLLENDLFFMEQCIQCEDADFNFRAIVKNPTIQHINKAVFQYNYSSKTAMNRWRRNPEKMIHIGTDKFRESMELVELMFPEDYQEKQRKLCERRIQDLFKKGIDLCCVNQASKENRLKVENLMLEVSLPEDAAGKTKRYYYMVINKQWSVIWIIAKLRMCYLWLMDI